MEAKDAVRTNFVLFKFISVSCSYTEYTLVLWHALVYFCLDLSKVIESGWMIHGLFKKKQHLEKEYNNFVMKQSSHWMF